MSAELNVRGEENTSLWRLAAWEQIGLNIVNSLTMLQAFNSNCAKRPHAPLSGMESLANPEVTS